MRAEFPRKKIKEKKQQHRQHLVLAGGLCQQLSRPRFLAAKHPTPPFPPVLH